MKNQLNDKSRYLESPNLPESCPPKKQIVFSIEAAARKWEKPTKPSADPSPALIGPKYFGPARG